MSEIKTVRNMRELRLMKKQLSYKEKLYEKEIAVSTSEVVDNLTEKLRDMALDLGSRLIIQLIKPTRKQHIHQGKD